MFRQAPAGRKHIRVCRTLSCAMAGAYPLMENLRAPDEHRSRASRRHGNAQSGVGQRRRRITASSLSNVSRVAARRLSAWWTTSCTKRSRRRMRPTSSLVTRLPSPKLGDGGSPSHCHLPSSAGTPDDFQKHRTRRLHEDIDCYLQNGGYEQLKTRGRDEPRGDCQRGQDVRSARTRRRGFSLRSEVELHQTRREKADLPHLQRGRIRTGNVQGSLHHSPGSASADRGHDHLAVSRSTCTPPTSTSEANFPKARRFSSRRSRKRARRISSGENMLGTGFDVEIYVHRGAGAYICGEETGLIESLEGKRAYPRIKPPYFPAVLGLYMCPTIVNNVETLCHVKHIIAMGGAEYAKLGTAEQYRHAHRVRERRCVRPGLFRNRSRRGHDGRSDQRDGGRAETRSQNEGGDSGRQLGESFARGRDDSS